MYDLSLPVVGRCQECGEDISDMIRIRATSQWIGRYQSDDRLRRGIDRAVERQVTERHARHCAGQPRARQRAVYALPA